MRANLKALRHTLKVLGPDWGLILTDVNRSPKGNYERLAFVFDTRRVKPSGLAAELVVPEDRREGGKIAGGALREQFDRTPYAVSFQCAGQTFILVTLHVRYGDNAKDRLGELTAIAEWLAAWAGEVEDYNQNLITLGDFNVERRDDPTWKAFTSTGLTPAPALADLTRTISQSPGDVNHYDQIAWFTEGEKAKLTLEPTGRADRFEWTSYILQDVENEDNKSARISDHFPLWCEFTTRSAAG